MTRRDVLRAPNIEALLPSNDERTLSFLAAGRPPVARRQRVLIFGFGVPVLPVVATRMVGSPLVRVQRLVRVSPGPRPLEATLVGTVV
jgi:hypothetical protein